jgi:DNA mismatch repair protein MutS
LSRNIVSQKGKQTTLILGGNVYQRLNPMNEMQDLSPMMRQFFSLKEKHPDALLLFRCGDFYETYCEDAVAASSILGITLTRRNNTKGQKGDEMAGFPHHALDTYLPKLIRAGRRVAICDQLEDPKLTQKLVKRGITEMLKPGNESNTAPKKAKQLQLDF